MDEDSGIYASAEGAKRYEEWDYEAWRNEDLLQMLRDEVAGVPDEDADDGSSPTGYSRLSELTLPRLLEFIEKLVTYIKEESMSDGECLSCGSRWGEWQGEDERAREWHWGDCQPSILTGAFAFKGWVRYEDLSKEEQRKIADKEQREEELAKQRRDEERAREKAAYLAERRTTHGDVCLVCETIGTGSFFQTSDEPQMTAYYCRRHFPKREQAQIVHGQQPMRPTCKVCGGPPDAWVETVGGVQSREHYCTEHFPDES